MTDKGYDGLLETAPDIAPGAEYSMICCFYFKIADAAPDCSPISLPRCTFLP